MRADGCASAETDEMLMIFPLFWVSISGATSLQQRYAPFRFTSSTRSQSSSVESRKSFAMSIPALFTRMSTRPNLPTAFETMRLTSVVFETSALTSSDLPPSLLISSTTCFPSSSELW